MNKKGFTLIELLAVIIILGILSTFSIMAINNLTKKQKEKNYRNSISVLLSGARKYFADYPSKDSVYVNDLINGNYVDLDSDAVNRIGRNTKVVIESCGKTSLQSKVTIEVRKSLKDANKKEYNDCGCKAQGNDYADQETKLCTN